MPIKPGDPIPNVKLKRMGASGIEEVQTGDLFQGRKVVLFGVPGAFTTTCQNVHVPGYAERADDIKAKGIDEIVCTSVNDPFVMQAWGEATQSVGKITMLPDWDGSFAKAMGLDQDLSGAGLGVRSKRYAMIVEDGKVSHLDVEEGRGVTVSGGEACLARL